MSKWTDERVELLTKLWCEGKTAKEIAGVLGDGVTRNAVIGKAHRLKLSGRVSPIQHNKSTKQEAVETKAKKAGKLVEATRKIQAQPIKRKVSTPKAENKPVKISRVEMSEAAEKAYGDGVKMVDLKDSMCKWPIGDPTDENFHFCGARKKAGSVYCDGHHAVAYNATVRNKAIQDIDESAGATRRDETDEMLASVANAG